MAAKKAAKKVTTTVRKVRAKATPDKTHYVVMERNLFSAKPIALYKSRETASNKASFLEDQNVLPYNKYTVQRVDLQD